ncbi:activated protein kinase kinase kinase 7 [Seminavis robusta]|uniref:non-specific serine/threonine protein kinase n=1 Tax=Seminavis robusta TaxID=568900 RepID=A0A9N8H8G7_9STRA|nr:activated protein kinase kinase kinase 7 [Seminavis robusta]|eukprot:Sro91_g047730.1 activated protein kinase kinase kinase 7 (429) ;mRNA; f:65667-66953
MTKPTRGLLRSAGNVSKRFGNTPSRQHSLTKSGSRRSLTKNNSKRLLFDAVSLTAQEAIEASPILSRSPGKSVELYHGDEVKKGKVILYGEFYDLYSVKHLRADDQHDASDASDSAELTATDSAKKYAVKLLSQKRSTEGGIIQQATLRLVLEAKYLARLSHPNLVKAKGIPFGEEVAHGCSDDFFLITERMTETLEARLERWSQNPTRSSFFQNQRLSIDTKRRLEYAKSLIDALKYLHDQNLVVLNLKPENIGFLPDDTIQITDLSCCRELKPKGRRKSSTDNPGCRSDPLGFGIDLMAGESTQSQMARAKSNFLVLAASSGGIPRYMAPEAIVSGAYTKAADTYSWSLVMYEMLAISKPYASFKLGQHLLKVCNEGNRPNLSMHKFPMEVEGLLQMSWRKTYSKRPSMNDLVEAFPCLLNLKPKA